MTLEEKPRAFRLHVRDGPKNWAMSLRPAVRPGFHERCSTVGRSGSRCAEAMVSTHDEQQLVQG